MKLAFDMPVTQLQLLFFSVFHASPLLEHVLNHFFPFAMRFGSTALCFYFIAIESGRRDVDTMF